MTTPIFQQLWDTPASDRGFIRFDHGEVTLAGLDHNPLSVLAVRDTPIGHVLTIHEQGGSYWVGHQLPNGYAGAVTYTILLDDAPMADSTATRYVRLSNDVPVKSNESERDAMTTASRARLTKFTSQKVTS